jgi:hypothetical protein
MYYAVPYFITYKERSNKMTFTQGRYGYTWRDKTIGGGIQEEIYNNECLCNSLEDCKKYIKGLIKDGNIEEAYEALLEAPVSEERKVEFFNKFFPVVATY